ncbi:MAG: MATE family efflux transporter [Treponema sp.]|jgi:putative MATE family efflux protein|nr:MATE family efflux transporter [Treponema sp.]
MNTAAPQDEKFIRMTTAPVERLVCGLAGPSIVINLISGLYNMADTYFVSSLGTSAAAAVGIAYPLMSIIQALGFFFGQGSGNFISRALGAQRTEQARKMAATGFFSALLVIASLSALGLANLASLAQFLGATPTIVPYATEYILFILIAAPFLAASMVLNQQLRFQGSAVYSMIGMVSGAVLNVFLDPFFIFFLGLGIRGASLATCISQCVSCTILLIGSSRKGNIPIQLRQFSPVLTNYKEIIRGGIPALLRQGLMSVSTVVTNHFSGVYGDAAIAAISIVNRLFMFASSAMMGFGQGFQPVCGFNYGARHYDRVKRAFWFCVRLASSGLVVIAVFLAIFSPQVIALFRKDDPEVLRIGILSLRLRCIGLPLNAWIIMSNMMTQTIGKPVEASLLALARQGLFLIPALFIFTPLLGLFGIQISPTVANIAAFFFAVPLVMGVLKELKEEKNHGRSQQTTA